MNDETGAGGAAAGALVAHSPPSAPLHTTSPSPSHCFAVDIIRGPLLPRIHPDSPLSRSI